MLSIITEFAECATASSNYCDKRVMTANLKMSLSITETIHIALTKIIKIDEKLWKIQIAVADESKK